MERDAITVPLFITSMKSRSTLFSPAIPFSMLRTTGCFPPGITKRSSIRSLPSGIMLSTLPISQFLISSTHEDNKSSIKANLYPITILFVIDVTSILLFHTTYSTCSRFIPNNTFTLTVNTFCPIQTHVPTLHISTKVSCTKHNNLPQGS